MTRFGRSVLCLLVASLLLAAAPVGAQARTSVLQQRTVKPEKGKTRGLSSGGTWLLLTEAGDLGRDLCRYDIEAGSVVGCAPFPGSVVAGESVVFSPDGTKVAFTEDWRQLRDDTDIWLYDSVAGTVTNLTDDGVDAGSDDKSAAVADLAPVWSPDGSMIAFVRSTPSPDGSWTSWLMQIPATGGTPSELSAIGAFERPVWRGMIWSADGSIRYAIGKTGNSGADGVWELSQCLGMPRQVVAAAELGLSHPVIVGGTDQGQLLITDADPPGGYVLVDVTTAKVESLAVGPDGGRMVGGGFSPDGGTLLVIRIAGQPTGTIFERDTATGAETALADLDEPIGKHDLTGGLDWATNGLAMVPGFGRAVSLISLSTSVPAQEPLPTPECAL